MGTDGQGYLALVTSGVSRTKTRGSLRTKLSQVVLLPGFPPGYPPGYPLGYPPVYRASYHLATHFPMAFRSITAAREVSNPNPTDQVGP